MRGLNSLLLVLWVDLIQAKHHYYEFVFTKKLIAPDNYGHTSIVINNQFPGPTIDVTMGDTVEVRVVNHIGQPLTIHYHGLVQRGTPESDGVPHVTQLPIKNHQAYTYKFNVGNQAGTWWYHSHTGLDAEQAFGALVVREKQEVSRSLISYNAKYRYDAEHVILLSEWWHKNPHEMERGLRSVPFQFIGRPNSVLNNGRTYMDWGGRDNSSLPFNEGYPVWKVRPGLTYRLRLMGANGLSFLSFKIPNHRMVLIEADGTYLEPVEVDHVEVNAGERYSVLVTFDQEVDNYYARTHILGSQTASDLDGYTVVHYEGAAEPTRHRVPQIVGDHEKLRRITRYMERHTITSNWYRANPGLLHYSAVPMSVNREIVLNVISGNDAEGRSVMTINGRVHQPRSGVTLDRVRANQLTVNSAKEGIYDVREGENVQIVVQKWARLNRTCAPHPWHLHGHSFHIVGQGASPYNRAIDTPRIDRELSSAKSLPRFKDTFTHYTNSVSDGHGQFSSNTTRSDTLGVSLDQQPIDDDYLGEFSSPISRVEEVRVPCGWYAIRFKADNPGSWFMHCHITAHLIMGKQLVINELPKSKNHW